MYKSCTRFSLNWIQCLFRKQNLDLSFIYLENKNLDVHIIDHKPNVHIIDQKKNKKGKMERVMLVHTIRKQIKVDDGSGDHHAEHVHQHQVYDGYGVQRPNCTPD